MSRPIWCRTAQTAACNRLHDIAERLGARWLADVAMTAWNRTPSPLPMSSWGTLLGTPRSNRGPWRPAFLHKGGACGLPPVDELVIRDRKGLEKGGVANATGRSGKNLTGLGIFFLSDTRQTTHGEALFNLIQLS